MYNRVKDIIVNALGWSKNKQPTAPSVFQYQLNDSVAPIVIGLELPEKVSMPIVVRGYTGQPVPIGHKNYRSTNVYVSLALSIEQMQSMIRRARTPLHKWAIGRPLEIVPDNGKMLNAYYNRHGLYFFHEMDPISKKVIYTADSTDIVTHELGHALLDAMRPDFWSVQALEIWSFHEAFADITAMLHLMQFDAVLEKTLEETNGTLKTSNNITRLAEEMGITIEHFMTGQKYNGPTIGLRDAINDFKYIDPRKLPKDGPRESLIAECHSFGRVFAGAWYQLLVEIFEKESVGNDPIKAFKRARDIAGGYLIKAIPQTPRVVKYHEAIAKSMLAIDKAKGGQYREIIEKVWKDRNLLKPSIKMLSNKTWQDVLHELKRDDEVLKSPNITTVKVTNNRTMRLSDVLPKSQISGLSTSAGDLIDAELEIPSDRYYEFDRNGNIVDEILPEEDEIISTAQACVSYIHYKNDVDDTQNTRWEITNGKLQRTYID